jgi:hypothetical protein
MQDMAGKRSDPTVEKPEEYNFKLIGEKVAEILMKAADDQLLEVENLVERTKILGESIRAQLDEHSVRLTDINRRVRALNDSVLAAHDKFINDK